MRFRRNESLDSYAAGRGLTTMGPSDDGVGRNRRTSAAAAAVAALLTTASAAAAAVAGRLNAVAAAAASVAAPAAANLRSTDGGVADGSSCCTAGAIGSEGIADIVFIILGSRQSFFGTVAGQHGFAGSDAEQRFADHFCSNGGSDDQSAAENQVGGYGTSRSCCGIDCERGV